MPPVKLLGAKRDPQHDVLDKLHAVAGCLDLAGQGGTAKDADEKLWQEYKALVAKYAKQLERA